MPKTLPKAVQYYEGSISSMLKLYKTFDGDHLARLYLLDVFFNYVLYLKTFNCHTSLRFKFDSVKDRIKSNLPLLLLV